MCEESFDKLRSIWAEAPWKLPVEISHSLSSRESCTFNLRTLRFEGQTCNSTSFHQGRNGDLDTVREWWLNDQKDWPTPETPKPQEEAPPVETPPEIKVTLHPIGGIEKAFAAAMANAPLPEPSKKKGLTTMAKRSLGNTVKRNALTAAKRTAAKAVKDAARQPLVALLSSSENPLCLAGASLLDTAHGDAALAGVVSVVAMLALPEKFPGRDYVEALIDELQIGAIEHATTSAYEALANPLVSGVTNALMAYGAKMAALEGAKAALGPGSEEE